MRGVINVYSPEVLATRLGYGLKRRASRRSHMLRRQTLGSGSRWRDSGRVCSFWRLETVIRRSSLSNQRAGAVVGATVGDGVRGRWVE